MINAPVKLVLSDSSRKPAQFRRITVTRKKDGYFAEKLTETQAFHEYIKENGLKDFLSDYIPREFRQINAFSADGAESSLKISKRGKPLFSASKQKRETDGKTDSSGFIQSHDRVKNYPLPEGTVVPALADMGVITETGAVAASMRGKFRQINRFLEIVTDAYDAEPIAPLYIVDFGCGKAYLTFALYHYFKEIKKIDINLTGFDLKAAVIENCNAAARKYDYENLRFVNGDIADYAGLPPDIVVSLHACDTATDHAIYNAIRLGAKMIFCAPCCQHELNSQIKSESLSILTKYGTLKERAAAILTDAIRADLLVYSGYKTQLLEFTDPEDTAKNLMIRAVKRNLPENVKKESLTRITAAVKEFNLDPMLLRLLAENETSGGLSGIRKRSK